MLDINRLKVASPCGVPWETMTGDDRSRMCGQCNLHVHNIAGLTAHEVQELIAKRDGRICIRLHRRADGTVITRDCPVGLRAYQKRITRYATAAFASVLSLVSISYGQKDDKKCKDDQGVKIERVKVESKTGEITGSVMDSNGAVIPGIEILLTHSDDEKPVKTRTNEEGRFFFRDITPGKDYVLRAGSKKSPFKSLIVESLAVNEGEKLVLDLSLEVAGDSVVVGIFAEEQLIDIGSSTVETRITRRKLESIPHR